MPKISKTTNPTGLKELDAKKFSVRLQTQPTGRRVFWLDRFDFAASGLPPGLQISCIAHAGSTEEFFRLGKVEKPSNDVNIINDLATDRPLKFRFLITEPGNPKLVAFADNVRAADESGMLGNSLVDIEPAELGGAAWKLEIPEAGSEANRPVLLVERSLFLTAQAAAKDVWIAVLVMPEVMRQIARFIANDTSSLDDQETWVFSWAEFLKNLGVSELEEDSDDMAKDAWADEVVTAFCAKPLVKAQFKSAVDELSGEQP
jgi:hypothetical protein